MYNYSMTVENIVANFLSANNNDIIKIYNKKEDKYYDINFIDASLSTRGKEQANIEFNWDRQ